MNSMIITANERDEFLTEERCSILEMLNTPNFTEFSVSRARVSPGITTALHALENTSEVYYILDGTGEMEVDGQNLGNVKTGDIIVIPSGKSQRIKNSGRKPITFLCICSPRFEPQCYRHLETSDENYAS